jgi:N-acetylglucosamine malate deacetylase 1
VPFHAAMTDPAAPPVEPLRWSAPPPGPVLVFAPHPDDEVAGPGGALALHRVRGDAVHVVVATDGSNGDPDGRFDSVDYAALRRAESTAGLGEVGVHDVLFWGFPDGCVLSQSDVEWGVQKASAAITAATPRLIYLPWQREGHPDHHALHNIVVAAIDRLAWPGLALGYEVWNALIPDAVLDITAVVERKRRAMLAHRSQTAYVQYEHALLGLAAYRSLVHQRGQGYAEAFVRLRGVLPI